MFACRWVGMVAALERLVLISALAVLFGLAGSIATPGTAQTAGKRIALLIANGNYATAGAAILPASKDAHLLMDELARSQFDVVLKENLGKEEMRAAVEAFVTKVGPGSVALLYFTGFGIQVERRSYLIPADAQIASEDDVRRDGLDLDGVLNALDKRGAGTKIAIIDASRRNPYERRFRGFFAGLAGVDAPGTLAFYSAAPGRLSIEDTANVSLFMGELTKEMRSPGISAEDVFTHARIGVSRASNGEQIPWVASSLVDDFGFGKVAGASTVPPPPAPAPVRVTPPPPEPVAASQIPPVPAPLPEVLPSSPAPAETKVSDRLRDCAECPEMIVLPPGVFDMGTRSTPFDRPVHKVTIAKPFAMALSEVTFDDWEACATAGGCAFRPNDQGWGAGTRPVVNVSWSDAHQYTAWLSKQTGRPYRLPSEAEWEYGARGGRATPFAWGPVVGTRMANCRDCQAGAGNRTLPVRSFAPNGFGLFDMAGNAAEWVEDCWNDTYTGAPRDGSAWATGNCELRVLRGGSFDSTSAYVKPSARFRYDADVRYYANGFRVVRDLP